MGVTGAGKSSFVQLYVDDDVDVGHGLESCELLSDFCHPNRTKVGYLGTVNVGIYVYRDQHGHAVYLVDTPGFNDAKKTDAEILKEISFTRRSA